MKYLKNTVILTGAGFGAFFGWIAAKSGGSYIYVAFGAFVGAMVGDWIADMLSEDKK